MGPEPEQAGLGADTVRLCFCVFLLCDQLTNQRAANGGGRSSCEAAPPTVLLRDVQPAHLSRPLFSRSFFFSSSHIFFGLPCCSPHLDSVSQSVRNMTLKSEKLLQTEQFQYSHTHTHTQLVVVHHGTFSSSADQWRIVLSANDSYFES